MAFRAGSIIDRAPSGSRPCINSVEPLISANNAVIVLRSPSGELLAPTSGGPASATAVDVVTTVARAGATSSGAPHSPQNLSPGWLLTPHLGQLISRGASQAAQNLRPSRLSLPHFEQRIFFHLPAVASSAKADGRIETSRKPVAGVTTRWWMSSCLLPHDHPARANGGAQLPT
jgi:hypothetical protein